MKKALVTTSLISLAIVLSSCFNSAQKHNDLGVRYTQEGKLDFALNEFSKAQELDPNNPAILCNMAAAYARKGDYLRAKDRYQEALLINPWT